MASSKERFADLGEAEIKKLLEEKDSVNTKKATKASEATFEEYLREWKLDHRDFRFQTTMQTSKQYNFYNCQIHFMSKMFINVKVNI